jgi:hypothetical protein
MRASEFRQRARQDFEPQVLFIPQSVGAPLDDAYLVVEPFDKTQRDIFILWLAVSGNAVSVIIDHLGKRLVALQALPFETGTPVLKELPRPSLMFIVPELSLCRVRHNCSNDSPLAGRPC